MHNASFYNAVICLGLYTSARVAEQVKAGITSLRGGQRMAGLAIGLTLHKPTATCCCQWRSASSCTADVRISQHHQEFVRGATIGLIELTAAARSMSEFSFQVFEAFTGATLIYIVINIVVVNGMQRFERRIAVPA